MRKALNDWFCRVLYTCIFNLDIFLFRPILIFIFVINNCIFHHCRFSLSLGSSITKTLVKTIIKPTVSFTVCANFAKIMNLDSLFFRDILVQIFASQFQSFVGRLAFDSVNTIGLHFPLGFILLPFAIIANKFPILFHEGQNKVIDEEGVTISNPLIDNNTILVPFLKEMLIFPGVEYGQNDPCNTKDK